MRRRCCCQWLHSLRSYAQCTETWVDAYAVPTFGRFHLINEHGIRLIIVCFCMDEYNEPTCSHRMYISNLIHVPSHSRSSVVSYGRCATFRFAKAAIGMDIFPPWPLVLHRQLHMPFKAGARLFPCLYISLHCAHSFSRCPFKLNIITVFDPLSTKIQ